MSIYNKVRINLVYKYKSKENEQNGKSDRKEINKRNIHTHKISKRP